MCCLSHVVVSICFVISPQHQNLSAQCTVQSIGHPFLFVFLAIDWVIFNSLSLILCVIVWCQDVNIFFHCIVKFKQCGPYISWCNILLYYAHQNHHVRFLQGTSFLYLKLRFFQNQTENNYSVYKSIRFIFKCNDVFLTDFIFIFLCLFHGTKKKGNFKNQLRLGFHGT